jgi:hypothetical protein
MNANRRHDPRGYCEDWWANFLKFGISSHFSILISKIGIDDQTVNPPFRFISFFSSSHFSNFRGNLPFPICLWISKNGMVEGWHKVGHIH